MANRSEIPAEAPPSYAQATGSSSSSSHPAASSSNNASSSSHLSVPGAGNGKGGVPSAYRRSMEDEQRPLPDGWVRTFDPQTSHQFFVDTTKDPPKSMWHHPYDDEEYLNTLNGEERERVEQESINYRAKHHPTKDDYIHAASDDEDDHRQHSTATAFSDPPLPPRPDGKGKAPEQKTFGRKLKDKVTGTTHEEREKMRAQRAEEERRAYESHLKIRQAMQKAAQTGQPQHIGKDREGKDIYVQPPAPPQYGYGGGYGYPYGGGYGNNGIYTTPNARYITPQQPYGRPYGGGFGGGYGMPLALGGGLLGGLLLGDMLF